jgi:hypothetical protein
MRCEFTFVNVREEPARCNREDADGVVYTRSDGTKYYLCDKHKHSLGANFKEILMQQRVKP